MDTDPYAQVGWATTGINAGNSFAPQLPRVHQLSYTDMPADDGTPYPWVRVRCSGCPGWRLAIEAGHSDDDLRRLEAMHEGRPG